MKTLTHFLFTIILLQLALQKGNGQDNYASNVRTTISEDNELFIHYDIVVNDGSELFKVKLEFTYEGAEISPNPNNLYGDYGRAMTPGNKIIFWNYTDDFSEDISKVKVKVFAFRELEPKARYKKDSIGNNGYAPCEVIFVNQSTNADKYEWNFGDPSSGVQNISHDENPIHTFNAGGIYTITLKATNTKLDVSNTFYETIVVHEHNETVADFQVIGYNREVPVTIKFQNTSKNADTFSWNFDDPRSGNLNNTSSLENPEHKYKNDGKYVVQLTAKNTVSGLSNKASKEVILIQPEKSTYQKHNTMKIVSIASIGTSAVTFALNRIYWNKWMEEGNNEFKNISVACGVVSGITFGLAAFCGVKVYIHAKKQSEAAKQVRMHVMPIQDGAMFSLSYNFK